jgi:hypothetical protein
VPGTALLLIRSNDPRMQMGVPSDFYNACLMEAHRTMIAIRHRQRKFPDIAGIGNEAILLCHIEMDRTVHRVGSECRVLVGRAVRWTAFLRKTLPAGGCRAPWETW